MATTSATLEVVTSIALLSDSPTTQGEYCVLASKRTTGEWHLHGGKVESGESAPEATRRESKEEHGVTVLKLDYVGTYYYPTRKVSLYVSFPGEWFGPVELKDKKNVEVIWQEQCRLHELTPALPSLIMSKYGLDGYLQGRRERMAADPEYARKEQEDKERRAKARQQQIAWREAHAHASTQARMSAAAALHAELHRSDGPTDVDEADKLDDERILEEELGLGRDSPKQCDRCRRWRIGVGEYDGMQLCQPCIDEKSES